MDKRFELHGYEALVADHLRLVGRVAELEERLCRLEKLGDSQTPSGQRVTGRRVSGKDDLDREPTLQAGASVWLLAYLEAAGEPVHPKTVVDAAEAAGYKRQMIYRARTALGSQVVNSLGRKHPQNAWMLGS
jgi:hypothetical protein